jgi:hypothetical protein
MATGYAHPTGPAHARWLADPVGGEKTFDFKALGVTCQRIPGPKTDGSPRWGPPFRSGTFAMKVRLRRR